MVVCWTSGLSRYRFTAEVSVPKLVPVSTTMYLFVVVFKAVEAAVIVGIEVSTKVKTHPLESSQTASSDTF